MKFAANGTLYRGSKPVMWSVVEKTALAEAEVEYEDYVSDTVWVKFPVLQRQKANWFNPNEPMPVVSDPPEVLGAKVVIWTTTPWTIPGNRAISFSQRIPYGLYRGRQMLLRAIGQSRETNLFWLRRAFRRISGRPPRSTLYEMLAPIGPDRLSSRIECQHPLSSLGYDFAVPLLVGEHVTDDAGTGFVHTAPGHGREDFDVWTSNARLARSTWNQHRHSLHRRRRRPLHRAGSGLHRQARADRKGREGRRQRRGDQGLDRSRHVDRAWAAQASISAFVALEEADHLPQHAAMVHRDGPAVCVAVLTSPRRGEVASAASG